MISFTVNAIPVAQPRQRTAVRKVKGKTIPVNYTPKDHPSNAFKASVRMALASHYQGPPLEGALSLYVGLYLPRPKLMMWKKKLMPQVPHDKKPDIDNLLKSLMDSLSGLAWRDDSQVASVMAYKFICAGGSSPRVSILIRQL